MKLIIAGSREFDDYDRLCKVMEDYYPIQIISGMARGADLLGRKWAHENDVPCLDMPANWEKYGKSAGFIRNEQMAKHGTHLLAFWNGTSSGTKHMIYTAKSFKLHTRIEIF